MVRNGDLRKPGQTPPLPPASTQILKTQPISYHDQDTPLIGFLAWDDQTDQKRVGILVVHGGAGLDQHARNRAQRFAAGGYVALACDMYGDGIPGDRQRVMACLSSLRDDLQSSAGGQRPEFRFCLPIRNSTDAWLPSVTALVGMTVLELAHGGAELQAVVSVHGSLAPLRPAQPSQIKAKILVCHGALDPHLPIEHVTAFIPEMNSSGADWQLIVYGNAVHGFTHEDADGTRIPGVAYNAPADLRSSAAIDSFISEIFGPV